MPITVTANNKTFEFPDGTSQQDIGLAIDDYFSKQAPDQTEQAPVTQRQPTQQPEQTAQPKVPPQQEETKEGLFATIKAAYEGSESDRTKMMPEILQGGVFSTAPVMKTLKIASAMPFTTDPMEMAKIIEEQKIPEIKISYEKTDDGVTYPVIRNSKTGSVGVLNKPGFSLMDAVQIFGTGTAFLLGGAQRKLGTEIARNVGIQGLIEAGQASLGGDLSPEEMGLAGLFGGVGKLAEDAVSAGSRLIWGAPSEESTEVIKEAGDRGLDIITSDVVEPTTRVGKLAQTAGENAPVLGMGNVQAKRQKKREQMVQDFGEQYQTSYDDILKSLSDRRDKIKSAAIKARQKAVNTVNTLPLESANTIRVIDEQIRKATTLPNGAPRRTIDTHLVNTLNDYRSDLIQDQRFMNLDMLRTNFRQDLLNDINPTDAQKGAEKQVYKAMTEDMDNVVKANMSENEFRQWKRGNLIYGKEAQKLKRSKIKNILNQGKEISSRDIDNQIFSVHDTARKNLYNSLDSNGRQNVRSAIVQNIIEKANSPDQFVTIANRRKDVINDFFKGSEKREFQGLVKALEASSSAQRASTLTPTGQQNMPYIAGASAIYDLGATMATLGSAGILARVYESVPMRNALLKLQATPKGSLKYEGRLNEVAEIANAALQTYRQSQQETSERQLRSENRWAN